MIILLKILIGLVLLFAAVVVTVFVSYFIIVVRHDLRWRKSVSDDYKIYSDGREER